MDRLENLPIFAAAAEPGSFVAASRRLGRSPAAITRAIAALEDRLAIRLFNRTTRSVALTDAGGAFPHAGRPPLTAFEDPNPPPPGEPGPPGGTLTPPPPETFAPPHRLPIAQDFMRDHP